MRQAFMQTTAIVLGALLMLESGCQMSGRPVESLAGRKPREPASKPPTPEQALEVQLALARTMEQQHESDQAAALYQSIVERNPKCSEAVHRLAICHDQAKRFEDSGRLFKQALKLEPRNSEIYCDLGYSQYLQRRWGESEDNLRQALKLKPEFKRAHNHLGMLLARTDMRDAAVAEFRRAGCTDAEAHINCAVALVLNERPEEAREEYELARQSGPLPKELVKHVAKFERLLADRGTDSTAPRSEIQLSSGHMQTDEGVENSRVSRH